MLARGLLFTLAIVSLIWVGYSSLNIVDREKEFDPHFLFNSTDQELLIINNSSEHAGILNAIKLPEATQNLIASICEQTNNVRIFASQNDGIILLQSSTYFNQDLIKSIFGEQKQLVLNSDKSFKIGEWKGITYKNSALLHLNKRELNEEPINFNFDKNAVGAIVTFVDHKIKVSDVYMNNNNLLEYTTLSDSPINAAKISDEKIFAPVVSTNIQSYTFYEVDYLRTIDTIFQNSPANNWVKSGVVFVEMNGKKALISDYILGQNPIMVLNDHFQVDQNEMESSSFEGLPLSQFCNSSSTIYVQEFNDYVVISTDNSLKDKIIGDFKLGNTIAQTPSIRNQIYGGMPQKVNYRHSDNLIKETKTVAQNVILSSLSNSGKPILQQAKTKQDLTLNIGEPIRNFYPISGRKVFVQTESDKLLFFDNGSKKWEMQLEDLSTEGELIDLFDNDKKQLLIHSSKQLHLITVLGEEVNGFPYSSDDPITQNATYYRWKGSGTFLIPSGENIVQVDTRGREMNIIKGQIGQIATTPVVWVSAGKLFLGINGTAEFEMINLENGKSYRKFANQGCSFVAKLPNEINLFGIAANKLKKVDQKGNTSELGYYENGKIVSVYQQGQNPTLVLRQNNTIKLINDKGIEWSSVRIPFNEIEAISIQEVNDKLLISLIDALENNSYFYTTDGQRWQKEELKGKLKTQLIQEEFGIDLVTVVDQMIVFKTL